MFKFEEICELIRLVGAKEIGSVELEHAGSRLKIEGVSRAVTTVMSDPSLSTHPVSVPVVSLPDDRAAAPIEVKQPAGSDDDGEDAGLHYVTSPIVGTFYSAPNPDADPYAKNGDSISKGQVLCIVEAMKLLNEIESDVDGTIVKIFPQNAEPIEFGSRLFAVKPA
ncbi:MAG: acetyl-CoA carboxylase biotin carboxyl carrier protein [bacterium]|nr:acetyl-CoA carboxylase biotin carboxyl carrier protein [bacterium]